MFVALRGQICRLLYSFDTERHRPGSFRMKCLLPRLNFPPTDAPMPLLRFLPSVLMLGWMILLANSSPAQSNDVLDNQFRDVVQPILREHCWQCHNAETGEGDLDLSADDDVAAVIQNFRRWTVVLDRLKTGDMPPEDAEQQLTAEQRAAVSDWIESLKNAEAERTNGDPGIVLARRLSSSEYDHTIRDLTGVDIRPAAEFPIDPANEAGFDNSGESLVMSPALLRKYLQATRTVADHMAITPTGLAFAPHPVITPTDRDKFCVNRIIEFYSQQNTSYEDFLFVLWRYRNRNTSAGYDDSLASLARQAGVSERYCQTLWELLEAPTPDMTNASGPITALRVLWRQLPEGTKVDDRVRAHFGITQMVEFIRMLRQTLVPEVPNLTAPEIHSGSQALVLWKNRQFVANRQRYAETELPSLTELLTSDFGLVKDSEAAAAMRVPDDENRDAFVEELRRFCEVFPDQFVVTERARVYLDPKQEVKLTGRFLSAGFHSQMGYFRDDAPLCNLILDESQRQQLDQIWLELDFVSAAPMRQYAGFIWFDRTDSAFMRDREFDRYRAEDKDNISEEKVRGLSNAYQAKAKLLGASKDALAAIQFYFDDMSKTFRRLETLKIESEAVQLEAVVRFAQRAYRRPLSKVDRNTILAFYQSLRHDDGLVHEDAIRDSIIRILMSPQFCYRVSLPSDRSVHVENGIAPLDAFSLASRLSYFLWSSMPDDELLSLAASGALSDPEVLRAQTLRMLHDERAEDFVINFAGNWLDFRHFDQHNGVDRNRFPTFTDELRQAMRREPIEFFRDLLQQDGSVLDFLYADHTFVNPALAKHYGVDDETIRQASSSEHPSNWFRLSDAHQYKRGGLLPMAVFLTTNSPGLRTSPVKRGNWVVQRILGEHVPPPPAAVPELPADESLLGELTLRETLARHREHPSCAGCHERIDSMGLVFEGFGPIGEMRDADLGGRDVDDTAVFPDDVAGGGLDGLRDYIRRARQDDFVDNLCRQLLAYGLGRTLQLSDELLIQQMKTQLAGNDHRFVSIFETIVSSPAFLNQCVPSQGTD